MICAANFRGEIAPKQAHDLVLEIRSKYDLPAFVFGSDGEFLGRVDTPVYAGSERGQ